MRVGELAIREVVIATPDEGIVEVARRMRDLHVGSIVVVEERDDRRFPIGVLTDRDMVIAIVAEELGHCRDISVRDVMTSDPVTIGENEAIENAVQRMRERGVRRLPVVDSGGRLVGIVAFDDLVEWVSEQMEKLVKLLAHEQRRERAGPH